MSLPKQFLAFSIIVASVTVQAQEKKQFQARRVEEAPRVDGELDDACWGNEFKPIQYIQTSPNNGELSSYKTAVQLVYTDKALYVGVLLEDPNPEKILREFGQRDDSNRNADYFGIILDTYNSGQNGFAFVVSAAGVQSDVYFTTDDDDEAWDAVWTSEVKITEQGWVVEMEIPYFALRFPKQQIQTWGLNLYRNVKREQEESFWNHVDNSVDGFVNQSGILHGLENIEPPLRLSFAPYVTSIYTHDGNVNDGNFSFAGGMDLKYGLNESYTLDMSLIPDFSQVRSDNIVYNISAFEVRFNENRQFFTEGTELFNKSNLFYSRRVGQTFGSVDYDPDTEEVVNSPTAANLINATKISGRGKSGLGFGFFNAVTKATHAKIRNTQTGETHQVQVDPLTNFNVFVVDQNLRNNSNINFTNTSVVRFNGGRDATVSALSISLRDKKNMYQMTGFAAVSTILDETDDTGYKYSLRLEKNSGTWQYGINRNVESDDYKINDLGFLRAANRISHFGYVRYGIFKPVGIFNNLSTRINVFYQQLFNPETFTGLEVSTNFNVQFKNFWGMGARFEVNPVEGYDYFEPREPGRYFLQLPSHNFSVWVESDSRKALLINAFRGRWVRPDWDQSFDWGGAYLRYRVSNKLSFDFEMNIEIGKKNRGFVSKIYDVNDELTDIIFGERKLIEATNIAGLNYTFNTKMGVNLRVRHYWSRVDYKKFYRLGDNGDMEPTTYTGLDANGDPMHHANFNAFNIDLVFFLQVAPGSFLNLVWKDAIQSFTRDTRNDYFQSLGNAVRDPHVNSISLRLTYFLDYLTIKNGLSRK